ncbi:MAG: TIM barrel protein [Bacteroidales bacterium]
MNRREFTRKSLLASAIVSTMSLPGYGAGTVLLVPGRVSSDVAYNECWERSVTAIKKILPVAEKLNIKIAIENVWNNFLLSPLEAARYVDQFDSPFVSFYFDCV